MSLQALRLANLHSLADTGRVPLKPITVLVGRNSSGKSSFLRAFPLLRQSVETPRSSPLLWYHRQYVDFGSFHEAVNDEAADKSITFEFSLKLPKSAHIALADPVFHVAVTLANGGSQRGAHVRSYEIHVEEHEIKLTFEPSGRVRDFEVNQRSIVSADEFSLAGRAYLLPTLYDRHTGEVTYQAAAQAIDLERIGFQDGADDVLLSILATEVANLFHGNASAHSVMSTSNEIHLGSRTAMLDRLKSLSDQKHYQERVGQLDLSDDLVLEIIDLAVARLTPYIIEATDQVLADLMSRVAYIGPKRAAAERAYRLQDLAVTEVDPRGDNLAMFLHSLSSVEQESLRAFTRNYLDFHTGIRVDGIHANIVVDEGSARSPRNIVDVGFGYAEILPVAAALWSSCIRTPRTGARPTSLLAIEQPELHLHPAFQAKLARMFAGALVESRKRGSETTLLIETHSEALISGLGQLVYEGPINRHDVQIVLFDRDPDTMRTRVQLAEYDDEGALRNWPYGFFLADD